MRGKNLADHTDQGRLRLPAAGRQAPPSHKHARNTGDSGKRRSSPVANNVNGPAQFISPGLMTWIICYTKASFVSVSTPADYPAQYPCKGG